MIDKNLKLVSTNDVRPNSPTKFSTIGDDDIDSDDSSDSDDDDDDDPPPEKKTATNTLASKLINCEKLSPPPRSYTERLSSSDSIEYASCNSTNF
jgi:hypothetical protein